MWIAFWSVAKVIVKTSKSIADATWRPGMHLIAGIDRNIDTAKYNKDYIPIN